MAMFGLTGGGAASGAKAGAALGSVLPGVGTLGGGALGMLFGGLKGLFGNKGAKNEAENARRVGQFRVDTNQKALTRRASLIGSALKKLAEHPEVYGKFISPDMFGYLPGPMTQADLTLPSYPQLKTQSNLSALLGGALGGAENYINDADAAAANMRGRVTSAGQPVG